MNKVEVCVTEGKLIGIIEESIHGDHYIAFRGIPYAKPPVGELRFKDPLPPETWSGNRDASKYGNIAVQVDIFTHKVIGDEDCLYLNVFTTKIETLRKRVVMVWIHGGGFFMGSGDASFYGPDHIVRKDIILVTLNYRLGVLGFLNLYHKMAAGNQGLKDVIMALQWIQKNISHFGGDPDNVTIFGESAGGAIVHYLTISPLAKGLFHKAICQSGVVNNPWAFTERDTSINNGLQLAEKLGKATSDTEVAYEFLKKIDARKLRKAEVELFLTEEVRLNISIAFTPTMDSESSNPLLPIELSKLLRNGIKMPLIFGYTSCEGTFFLRGKFFGYISKETLKKIDSDFKKVVHPRILCQLPQIPITISDLRSLYFGDKEVSEETLMNHSDFLGDQCFYSGIMEAVDTEINSGTNEPVYLYKFSYESKTSPMKNILDIQLPGTSHIEELGYLFHPHLMKDLGLSPAAPDSEDYRIINCLTQMWTNFAKTGNPTPANEDLTLANYKWTPLKNGNAYDYLNINIKPQMETLYKGKSVGLLMLFCRQSSVSIMSSNRVAVNVREGKLIGIIDKNIHAGNYIAFRGIPYAKPPVGKLRFKDPVPPEPWSGSRDSSKHGNIAVQKDPITREMIGDEDCLYLNVYTADIESWRKRPVMVWIHGGAFSTGSGDATIYGPDYIVRKDVVLVTLNYRLGVLGFLNLNDKVATGNQGMKDVVMALQWVQKNISKFTGDPGNVTIFGESAGGAIVHYLTLSPLSKGLNKEIFKEIDSDFKKTILPQVLSTLPQIPITVEELRFLYFGNKAVSEETLINYADFLGDVLFYRGIMEVADTQMSSDAKESTYLYKFSYESETSPWKKFLNITLPGVTHSEELFYLFYPHMMKHLGVSPLTPDSNDYKIMNRLTQMWTDFAKTGNPTPAITNSTPIKWTPLKRGGNMYDYLNINIEFEMKTLHKEEQRWDWKNMKHKL
ncbi:hypothetical protein ACFW04_005157 [Cataglyphis niger]